MRDLMNHIHPIPAIPPGAAITDNTAVASAIIDTLGFGSLTFVITTGSLADSDATFAVLIEDGDEADLSDAAAVPDDQLVGTESLAGFTYAHDNATRKIGYAGFKRYVRMTITGTGNSGAAYIAAVALLGHPMHMPTPNPPV